MKRFPILLLALSVSCATAPSTAPALEDPAKPANRVADVLITGATVITIAGEPIADGAVAVRDGRIAAVGTAEEIRAEWTAHETIQAEGMALMPGLVNAHTHAPMTLFRGIADDLDLMDWLQNYIFPAEKRNVDPEFVRWGTKLAAAEMIRSGTTTFADMYYFEADIAEETRAAGLRAVLGQTMLDFPAPDNATWDDAVAYVKDFVERFRNDPLITPALAPHAPYTVSTEHLKAVRELADELGAPILIHVAETTDELRQISERHDGMRPAEYLESIGLLGDDVVAAHGVWLSPQEIGLMARSGTGVVHCPESNMMLASGVAPVPAMLSAGVEVGLGTDGPAGSNNDLDMLAEMASAARLQKIWHSDPQALGATDVLRMATLGGAEVLGLDEIIGSVEVGKRADLILIDLRDPGIQPVYSVESAIVYAAEGADVIMTMVEGRILMRDRNVLTLDVAAVLEKAEEFRRRITASLAPEN